MNGYRLKRLPKPYWKSLAFQSLRPWKLERLPKGNLRRCLIERTKTKELVEDCLRTTELVYNTRSPHTLSWTNNFLPTLAAAGLRFERVSFSEWLEQLESRPSEASQRRNAGRSNYVENTNHNPAVKLL